MPKALSAPLSHICSIFQPAGYEALGYNRRISVRLKPSLDRLRWLFLNFLVGKLTRWVRHSVIVNGRCDTIVPSVFSVCRVLRGKLSGSANLPLALVVALVEFRMLAVLVLLFFTRNFKSLVRSLSNYECVYYALRVSRFLAKNESRTRVSSSSCTFSKLLAARISPR